MTVTCIEWTGFKSRDGYGIAHRGGKLIKRHRMAYCEANGLTLSDIDGKVVRHKCDNRACLNPDHLEIGTSQDNTRDRRDRGRCARGAANGNARLSEEKVREIRSDYIRLDRSRGTVGLAKKHGVSASLIGQIVAREIWTHVGDHP